jgi:putative holliday junction resolvase
MSTQNPILAIDYGLKRIGLAISDTKGIIASPLKVITITKKRKLKGALEDIIKEVEKNNVKTILIGKPQEFKKEYSLTLKKIYSFANKLSELTTIPIIFQDESYSTIQAQNMLLSFGQSRKSSKGKIDMIAAEIFLQDFLNSEQVNNEKHS